MSNFFHRLIQQSGVRLQQPPVAPVGPTNPGTGRPLVAAAETIAPAAELVEMHEPRMIDPTSPATVSQNTRTTEAATSPASTPQQETRNPAKPPRALDPPTTVAQGAKTFLVETAPVTAAAFNPPAVASAPTASPAEAEPVVTPPPAPAVERAPADSAEILQAVMKWISAGPRAHPPQPVAAVGAPPDPATATPIETNPAAAMPKESRPDDRVPERVIKMVERAASAPRQPIAAVPVARGVAPPPATVQASPRETMQVSIGSIQVRVEAPAPPAAKPLARPTRPAEPRREAGKKSRPSGFSQLRRHYIIPH